MPRFPGFIGGSNTSQSLIADSERTVNLYVESTQAQAANSAAGLMLIPGFRAWSTVADGGTRGSVVANGRLFFDVGPSIWEFSSTAVSTKRGTVAQDANPAQMIWNGVVGGQLGYASGGNVYSYNLTTNVQAGPHLTNGYTHLAYSKGYGLALNATTGKVNLSGLNDLSTWSAGTFFQRSNFADPWQAMFVDSNGLVWLIGTETFEVWSLSNPSSTQPFAPLSGLAGRFGIASPFGYGVSGAANIWIARSGPEGGATVVSTRGSIPQAVSTYAVNTAMGGYRRTSKISDAECMVYHENGHTFFNFSFPSPSATWTLDAEVRGWAERGKWNALIGKFDVWSPRVHADCFGKHLVGDRATGTIWDMSDAYFTDIDGTGIEWLRRTPGATDEHRRIPLDQIELLMDVGVAGQNVKPLARLRLSGDGRTYGNERQASMGRVGEYGQRVYWNQCGAPPQFVAEVRGTAVGPTRIIDAFINNFEKVA